MRKTSFFFPLIMVTILVFYFGTGLAQQKTDPDSTHEKMQWFADARLGIIVYSGLV
jgi:hypothetical protein